MTDILFSWIGSTDLEKFESGDEPEKGPLARAVLERTFNEVHVASNYAPERTAPYFTWLRSKCGAEIRCDEVKLKSAVDYGDIYRFLDQKLRGLKGEHRRMTLTIHLSPGTPQMAQVSVLLGTYYSVKFLQSSREQGLVDVDIPFDISAEFLPQRLKKSWQAAFDQASGGAPVSAQFSSIIGESAQLRDAISVAEKFATLDIPVLILGETGTGKELFANAIANSNSKRAASPYKSVNCGAIAGELINSELFGHVKGAFTDAKDYKAGIFEQANGGTVFLDEFGELPLEAQVRLLRVLGGKKTERRITPVGGTKEVVVDVRIIAATNKDLSEAIAKKKFRADLYWRVVSGVVKLPALREREGDINLLTNYFMDSIREEYGFEERKLSPKAMNVILAHDWPGNVRELENTLTRACALSEDKVINHQVMAKSILEVPVESGKSLLKKLGGEFRLSRETEKLEKDYIEIALIQAKNKKTKAATLLGIQNHQTLTTKMRKYGIEG